MNNPYQTKIRKIKSEIETIQLYYEKDSQKIANISCDKGIIFFTEDGFHVYPPIVKQVLDIAENFQTIYQSLP